MLQNSLEHLCCFLHTKAKNNNATRQHKTNKATLDQDERRDKLRKGFGVSLAKTPSDVLLTEEAGILWEFFVPVVFVVLFFVHVGSSHVTCDVLHYFCVF